MSLLNEKLLEQSDYVQDIYATQSKIFSAIEHPFLIEIIRSHNIKSILDVGTGEGNFIASLAELTPDTHYTAVEGDKKLIDIALEKNSKNNITFINEIFDENFAEKQFDLIIARFAVEHMTDIGSFFKAAYKRLKPKGIILITEYYCDVLDIDNDTWRLFRSKEIEMYEKLGSKPRTPIIIPKKLKESGFSEITSMFKHITPTTIGAEGFYKIILSYILGYSQMAPEIFSPEIKNKIINYCIKGISEGNESEDRLFLTHSFGIKA